VLPVLPFAPVSPVAPCGPGGPAGSEKQALSESDVNAAIARVAYFMVISPGCFAGSTHVNVCNFPDSIGFGRE
jgi:hypothetical protein